MSEELPKCRTCGSILAEDLNGDLFCMTSVVLCENHDDHYPRKDPIQELISEFVEKLEFIKDWHSHMEIEDINKIIDDYIADYEAMKKK